MESIISPKNLKEIKKKSLSGIFTLIFRTFFLQLLSLGSIFFLTVYLDPKVFGVFFLVSAFVSFFGYFSDVGLAAALIQKESVSDEELKTTFTVQQVLVLILIILMLFFSFFARKIYGLTREGMELFYALVISFFLSSLKTIPSVILERKLEFNRLVVPQIVENIIFNLVSVFLAWKGWGIRSFTIAVLIRGVVGLIAIYLVSPWRIKVAFNLESFQKLIKFGLPYQINTFIAVAKDDLMTIFLGGIIGTQGLGYLGWAKKWAEQPLRFLMDNVLKVTFPAYSRLQKDRALLSLAVEKSIFFLTFLTFPMLLGISLLAPRLILVIPRYRKWEPALIPLYLYCFNSAWAVVSTVLTNFFNSIGKIKVTLKLMVMGLVLTWILMPILGIKFGYLGIAWSVALIAVSSAVVVFLAKREINFSLLRSVFKPILATLMMGLSALFLMSKYPSSLMGTVLTVVLSAVSYLIFSYILMGGELINNFSRFIREVRVKN